MILCQISDLHIKPERKLAYGVVDTATMLERCIAHIGRLPQRPDAVLATGDLVDGATRSRVRVVTRIAVAADDAVLSDARQSRRSTESARKCSTIITIYSRHQSLFST